MSRATVVYRIYSRSGRLLYVGVSRDFAARFSHHRSDKPRWLRWAVSSTIEQHESRRLARRAERAAIRNERPIYNKQNKGALEAPP